MVSSPLTDRLLRFETILRLKPIPMLIVCPNCTTSYEIAAEKLGDDGRSVRCARCRTVWRAEARAELVGANAAWGGRHDVTDYRSQPPQDLDQVFVQREALPNDIDGLDAPPQPDGRAPHEHTLPAIIENAPPLAPAAEAAEAQHTTLDASADPAVDIETVASRRAPAAKSRRRSRKAWRRPSLPVVIFGLAAVIAALIGWRAQVVRFAPQTGALYARIGLPVNLRGLAIDEVRISGETQEDVPVLVVQGTVTNVTNRTVDVPRLRFALRSPSGVEIYAWTAMPGKPALAPGEALPFRSRLASPPTDARDVQVRFFHHRDLASR